jgi:hypothetical protein
MFISSFSFSKINRSLPKKLGQFQLIEHVFHFRGNSGKRYIVVVEEYDYSVYIVKFYLQEKKRYPDRFNQLSGLNECSRVLTTVGQIIRHMYNLNPFASFGFIGSCLPGEKRQNTKRYRLYSNIVKQVISPVLFEHRESTEYSAYLLVNRDNQEQHLLEKIELMFNSIYLLHQ